MRARLPKWWPTMVSHCIVGSMSVCEATECDHSKGDDDGET